LTEEKKGFLLRKTNVPNSTMLIFVNFKEEIITLDVEPFDTIKLEKAKIYLQAGIPPAPQALIFDKKLVKNEQILSDCNIQNDSSLILVLGRCG
jgi:hypothetical protein